MARSKRIFLALLSSARKEFLRDGVSAFFTFIFPLIFLFVFGLTSQIASSPVPSIAVADLHGGDVSRKFVEALSDGGGVDVVETSVDEGQEALDSGEVIALVVIPETGPENEPIALYTEDGQTDLVTMLLDRAGAAVRGAALGFEPFFTYQVGQLTSERPNAFTYILPGIVALALMQLGLFGTATPLLVARDRGVLRHLSITPLPQILLLAAQVSIRFVVAALQVVIVLGIGVWFYGIQVEGAWAALIGVSLLGAVMLTAMGYMLAGVAPGQQAGMSIIMMVNFAMLIFGQIFFDLTDLVWVRPLIYAMPVTYLADAFRQVVTGMPGLLPVGVDALAMAAWTSLAVVVALKTFRFDMEA